ncbi:MAG: PQQ-binding-like beta-propeller repeat protein, partial [Planctomycetota bacterium]
AFDVSVPTWGFCGSPLVVGDRLLMQVAQDPGLIALDVWTGKLLWKTSKPEAAYSSLMLDLNPNARSNETAASDQDTVIGLSAKGYFAVRARDGKMIWQRQPELDGDFGVPCPVVTSFGVVFCGENNGLLIRDHGKTELRTLDDTLLADSHTPVAIGNDLLVAYEGLHRIDLTSGKRLWSVAENRITKYASVIASDTIAWVFTEDAEWLSVDAGRGTLLDRRMLSENSIRTLTHPAVAGDRIIVRVGDEIRCWKL